MAAVLRSSGAAAAVAFAALLLAALVAVTEAQTAQGFGSAAGLERGSPAKALEELGGTRGHSPCLVGLGLLLSLAALLATGVLGVVALAAVGGAPVPLLAALPTSSAALLAVQLLARVAQEAHAASSLVDLGRSLAWAAPPAPDWEFALVGLLLCGVYACRRLVAGRHCVPDGAQPPHGLAAGAWEMRALGLLAFPLTAAATGILIGRTERPLLGSIAALLVLAFIMHNVMLTLKFVTEVLEEGRVLRVSLPATAGGEVFVDRLCDQLLALPMVPKPSGCPGLFGDWAESPGWCVAPAVASVKEVEQRGPSMQDPDLEVCGQWPGGNPWCSVDDSNQATGDNVELEDELQGRPLLDRVLLGHEEYEADGASPEERRRSPEEEAIEGGSSPGSGSPEGGSPEGGGGGDGGRDREAARGTPLRPAAPSRPKPSAVVLAHPVRVTTVAAYEVKTRDLVAGVVCIPWLDCAVPAGVLPRIEELGGDTEIRVHPGQLSGPLTRGRFAACFDWGTRWPLRWTVELALKAALGIWATAPLRGGPAPGLLSGVGHLLMLVVASAFTYGALSAGPYEHRNDDVALVAASLSSVFIVLLRALGEGAPGLAFALATAAGGLALVPCALALFAAVGLASATLGQLEAQGLQDRCLPQTVPGWCQHGRRAAARNADEFGGIDACGPAPEFADGVPEGHAVEAVMPGQRKAFSIVLPAVSRPRVVHAQLLPPVAGRNGDPECQPPCVVTGERSRLPVLAALLFPSVVHPGTSTSLGGEVDAAELDRRRSVPPLLALLAPGHTGRLVYVEPEHNEGGAEWRQAIESFFGLEGGLLAEEAERLVEQHALEEEGTARCVPEVLVVVEVLPAWAAEFLDERRGPPEST